MKIQFPSGKFKILFSEHKRYKVFFGGRGSGKSWAFATALVVLSMKSKIRILCARQLQTSIANSVHKLLSDTISRYKMDAFFNITRENITCTTTGSEFIFKGVQNNPDEIKSIEGVNICWVEEGQNVSQESWDILIPTIRQEGSEIWVSFNPKLESDPTYKNFVSSNRPDCSSILVNYYDNRFFPETLREEMEYLKETDYEKYENVWLGKCVVNTDAQVYKDKFEMKNFETPKDARFFFGADWGFAKDPTAITRCFIQDQCLYIDYESGGVGVEFEELPALFDFIPEVRKWKILADNARPETISFVHNKGFNIEACPKWKGSIEDGVEYIRSFRRIYVHPRCPKTYEEFKMYSYKTDKLTNEILPIIVDKDNHYLDSLRYGLNSYIQKDVSFLSLV